jgi:hypothetical protein
MSGGEAIDTDDPNYDPERSGMDGFERSAVKKRLPGK